MLWAEKGEESRKYSTNGMFAKLILHIECSVTYLVVDLIEYQYFLKPLAHILRLLKWIGRYIVWTMIQTSIISADAYANYEDEYGKQF